MQGSEQKVLAGEQSAKQLEGRLVEKEKRIDEGKPKSLSQSLSIHNLRVCSQF